jgi:hypothetical protein
VGKVGWKKVVGDKVAVVLYKYAQYWPFMKKSLNRQAFICKNPPFLYQKKGARGID